MPESPSECPQVARSEVYLPPPLAPALDSPCSRPETAPESGLHLYQMHSPTDNCETVKYYTQNINGTCP